MESATGRSTRLLAIAGIILVLPVLVIYVTASSNAPPLKSWHTEVLTEEFTEDMVDEQVYNFEDYLELEQRLFRQLDEQVYARTETGPAHVLERYSSGSAADPNRRQTNWNQARHSTAMVTRS